MEINIKHEITLTNFEDIIITALEGGSNYWYWLKADEISPHLGPRDSNGLYNGKCFTEAIAKALYDNPEFKMDVYDYEDMYPTEPLGTCTQESMLKALEKCSEMYPEVFASMIAENYDADDADTVFQLAVMGEVRFG